MREPWESSFKVAVPEGRPSSQAPPEGTGPDNL
jgi:hypothetical protein